MTLYPVQFDIDYPRKSNRVTVFFRLFLAIPVVILLMLLISSTYTTTAENESSLSTTFLGIIFVPTVLMILVRQKYPKWWYDWNMGLTKFLMRVASYLLLLRDEYPSTDEDQAVHVVIPYPDVKKDLNRWLPLVKWLLAIPHLIILSLLSVAMVLCSIAAWFVILFTSRYPRSIFDFVVGSLRWSLRVVAYVFLLTTDIYPPFRLND
ncbi:DUF4389 domain-containing protein [candidate division KSB1 bacterium]|nr:DUF4389 domain-containing protein [candidate division KSB1 bacterium]